MKLGLRTCCRCGGRWVALRCYEPRGDRPGPPCRRSVVLLAPVPAGDALRPAAFRKAVFNADFVKASSGDWPRAVVADSPIGAGAGPQPGHADWMRQLHAGAGCSSAAAATVGLRLLGDDFLSATGFGLTIAVICRVLLPHPRRPGGRGARGASSSSTPGGASPCGCSSRAFEAVFFFFKQRDGGRRARHLPRRRVAPLPRGAEAASSTGFKLVGRGRLVLRRPTSSASAGTCSWNRSSTPIKHFPVVTVSHKLLLPLVPSLADAVRHHHRPPACSASSSASPASSASSPGNSRRTGGSTSRNAPPRRIEPAADRLPRGERDAACCGTGFHSGSIPKAFAGLRNSDKPARQGAGPTTRRFITSKRGCGTFVDRLDACRT